MSDQKHTPTPLILEGNQLVFKKGSKHYEEDHVCVMSLYGAVRPWEARAKQIVHRYNTHDALVEALYKIHDSCSDDYVYDLAEEALELAKHAKGGQA